MRNEPLATINQSQPSRIPDRPQPKLLSISWTEFDLSSKYGEREIQVQHASIATTANAFHRTFDYTPRPEAWGINE
jgi:hypothetical protein